MSQLVSAVRSEAARLLQEDVVDVVIGFQASTPVVLPDNRRPSSVKRRYGLTSCLSRLRTVSFLPLFTFHTWI